MANDKEWVQIVFSTVQSRSIRDIPVNTIHLIDVDSMLYKLAKDRISSGLHLQVLKLLNSYLNNKYTINNFSRHFIQMIYQQGLAGHLRIWDIRY